MQSRGPDLFLSIFALLECDASFDVFNLRFFHKLSISKMMKSYRDEYGIETPLAEEEKKIAHKQQIRIFFPYTYKIG